MVRLHTPLCRRRYPHAVKVAAGLHWVQHLPSDAALVAPYHMMAAVPTGWAPLHLGLRRHGKHGRISTERSHRGTRLLSIQAPRAKVAPGTAGRSPSWPRPPSGGGRRGALRRGQGEGPLPVQAGGPPRARCRAWRCGRSLHPGAAREPASHLLRASALGFGRGAGAQAPERREGPESLAARGAVMQDAVKVGAETLAQTVVEVDEVVAPVPGLPVVRRLRRPTGALCGGAVHAPQFFLARHRLAGPECPGLL
mmetsp:Transcript_4610/g.14939  ORF Transcript_4610/g.14939 Transcript_4610/m.14939 type:complete len:253 (-) Transcript_4610:108-866(-)